MIVVDLNEIVNFEAIMESVQLASQALLKHADEFFLEQNPA
jgi:hypothetical protein